MGTRADAIAEAKKLFHEHQAPNGWPWERCGNDFEFTAAQFEALARIVVELRKLAPEEVLDVAVAISKIMIEPRLRERVLGDRPVHVKP